MKVDKARAQVQARTVHDPCALSQRRGVDNGRDGANEAMRDEQGSDERRVARVARDDRRIDEQGISLGGVRHDKLAVS